MNTRALLTAALLAVLPAGGVIAQEQEAARARARVALPESAFESLDALARRLGREGVPAEPIYTKALEGVAKGVPPERLLPALEAYGGRLRQAHAAFGPRAEPPLTIAGADALQRGVDAGSLRALGQSEGRSPMAVLVLADLVETGVPADHALELVREALQQRTREQEMLGMPAQVRRLMREGRTARDAVEQVRRTIQRRRGSGVTAPVAPGSEPLTAERLRRLRRGGG